MKPSRAQLERDLAAAANPIRAAHSAGFFRTGKGQYGEGDRFLGIPVPIQRRIALGYCDLTLRDLERLLDSPMHEYRFAALAILVVQYKRSNGEDRDGIVAFYLQHTSRINNWDLVDTSAPYILGDYLRARPRDLLNRLAASSILWERRIAIVSTLALIKRGEIEDTFRIAAKLLSDEHELIHKAVGWMLRETGKVSRPALLKFISTHYKRMPRTALRYAIERFPPRDRERILAGDLDYFARSTTA
jgi:3-methyladenine DNA glycosylase AlkD